MPDAQGSCYRGMWKGLIGAYFPCCGTFKKIAIEAARS